MGDQKLKAATPLLDLLGDEWRTQLGQVLRHIPSTTHTLAPAPRTDSGTARLFHDDQLPRVVNDFAIAVADPVQVVETEAVRVVVILRLYAVAFDRSTGMTRIACLADTGESLIPYMQLRAQVRLLNSPHGKHWTFHWLKNWCQRHGFAWETQAQRSDLQRAARRLNYLAMRSLDLRAMRRMIASALNYDPTHWRRAVRLASAAHRVPTCHDYNDALRLARPLEMLESEAPNLMAAWFALAREQQIDADLEPKAALKKWVRGTGASARAWRSLAASPSRVWMSRARHAKSAAFRHLGETALLIDRFETSVPVPLRIVNAATARLDRSIDQTERMQGARARHYASALRAAKWAIENDAWPRFVKEFDAVDLWFDLQKPQLDKLQRKRGWQWLVRKASAWAEKERRWRWLRVIGRATIPSLYLAGYEFKAVRDSFELWEAGCQLRNCLGQERTMMIAQRGRSLFVLAKRASDGRAVAVLQIWSERKGSALCVRRANGFANGPLPASIAVLVKHVVAHFEALRVHRPPRSPQSPPKSRPSTAGESNVGASANCTDSKTDVALQRLTARTGFQMSPTDPMRAAAAQMEICLTMMLCESKRLDSRAATTETQKLISRLQKSAKGPIVQSRRERKWLGQWQQNLAFVPGRSPTNSLDTPQQWPARKRELEDLLLGGTEGLRTLVNALEQAYGGKLRVLSADIASGGVGSLSGPALLIDSIGTQFESPGLGMVNNTTEPRALVLCRVIGTLLNVDRVGAIHLGHFKKLKVVWHREAT